ncbi:MAG: hypothetical protein II372_04225, partial [Clostridia bacterium]|nr:hypothetical protein [Clostridia bacterium]
MTLKTLKIFGVTVEETETGWKVPGGQSFVGPCMRFTEGDWSNAAFWLTAGAIKGSVGCQGLDMESAQGDRAIVSLLEEFGAETKAVLNQITATNKEMKGIRIDASQIPDLVPVLCVAGAAAEGKTEIYNGILPSVPYRSRTSPHLVSAPFFINSLIRSFVILKLTALATL